MNDKIKEVAFIDGRLRESFEELNKNKSDRKLYDFIARAINDLKERLDSGIRVPSRLIPKEYSRSMGLQTFGSMTCLTLGDCFIQLLEMRLKLLVSF